MVNITKFAVRKPVTIIMCLITIAYFGLQALMGTKVEVVHIRFSDRNYS